MTAREASIVTLITHRDASTVSFLPYAAATPPTVTAISPSTGSTLGGTVVQITVLNSVGCTGGSVGGVALTAFSIVNGTTVQGTTGAHAGGAVNVTVTNGAGTSPPLVGAFTYVSAFDPTTLALSGYWRANYTGAPWAATATAGISGTTGNLVTAASDPTTGTAQNGKTPAAFAAASSQFLRNSTTMASVITAGAGTIFALAYFASEIAANAGRPDFDPPLLGDSSNGYVGLAINTTGAMAWMYDGAYKRALSAAVSTGAYHLLMSRWDGTNIGITVDSAAEVTLAAGNVGSLAGTISVGQSGGGVSYLDGRILEVGTAKYKFSNTDYANFKSYCNATYGLSL